MNRMHTVKVLSLLILLLSPFVFFFLYLYLFLLVPFSIRGFSTTYSFLIKSNKNDGRQQMQMDSHIACSLVTVMNTKSSNIYKHTYILKQLEWSMWSNKLIQAKRTITKHWNPTFNAKLWSCIKICLCMLSKSRNKKGRKNCPPKSDKNNNS